jgi:hypothetical protein
VSSITQAEVEARVAQVKIQAQAVWTGRAALARLTLPKPTLSPCSTCLSGAELGSVLRPFPIRTSSRDLAPDSALTRFAHNRPAAIHPQRVVRSGQMPAMGIDKAGDHPVQIPQARV